MAKETVTLSASTAEHIRLASQRIDTANSAAYEIELLATAMQKFIEAENDTGEIFPVTRGMVLRIASLATAINEALDPDYEDQERTENTVYVKHIPRLVTRS